MKRHLFVKSIVFVVLLSMSFSTRAQPYVENGKPMPDFVLHNIIDFPKKQATLKDFKGKWLVMDFWSISCGACVAGLPGKNVIQKELGDKVQVMLVGVEDPENKTRSSYAIYKKKMNLQIPCAFDSTLANVFDIGLLPYIVVVDPDGMVRAVTTGINSKKMAALIEGGHPQLSVAYHMKQYDTLGKSNPVIAYDAAQPFLVNGNGAAETDFLFRSVLSQWDGTRHPYRMEGAIDYMTWSINPAPLSETGRFELLGAPRERLYQLAYYGRFTNWNPGDTAWYGQYYPGILYETKDSNDFQQRYSYSLIMPKEKCSVASVQKVMQKDLDTYFGYDVHTETRKYTVYKLVADAGAEKKLTTPVAIAQAEIEKRALKKVYKECPDFYNMPFSELISWIRNRVEDNTRVFYVEDATGITGNVSLKLDCMDVDFSSIVKALEQNGLHLVPTEKEMKVLVIKDK